MVFPLTRTRDYWLKAASTTTREALLQLKQQFLGHNNLVLGWPMLSSRPTDVPHLMTKTPGRALANRGENLGVLQVKAKNINGAPRTPFQPASARESFFFPVG